MVNSNTGQLSAFPQQPRSNQRFAQQLPPHDISAEEAVVAAILLDETALVKVSAILQIDDFFDVSCKAAFEASLLLEERSEQITATTVGHELERLGLLDAVGGEKFLAEVISKHFTAEGVEAHARIVRRDGLYRQAIEGFNLLLQKAYEGGADQESVISMAEELLLNIRGAVGSGDFQRISEILEEMLANADDDENLSERVVESGFHDLDAQLNGGFQRGNLIIVAARPGHGKSALALNFARHCAMESTGTVALFSLEMSGIELAKRLLASESGISSPKLTYDDEHEVELQKVMTAHGSLSEANIYINEQGDLTVAEIRAAAKRMKAEQGLDLLIVDYLQLVSSAQRYDSPVASVTQISRTLKQIARELDVPVIAAAQLNRAVEQRKPHIPILSDLRESGSIEQDADVVMFIYREAEYHKSEDPQDWPPDLDPRQAKIIIAKHRNGATGVIDLHWEENLATFKEYELYSEPAGNPQETSFSDF